MVEYKDVMLGVAGVAATVAGFGLVFLAIVTTFFLANKPRSLGFFLLAVPALVTTALGMVAAGAAVWWLIQHAGTQGQADMAYAAALWAGLAMGVAVILTALDVVFAYWGAVTTG